MLFFGIFSFFFFFFFRSFLLCLVKGFSFFFMFMKRKSLHPDLSSTCRWLPSILM